MPWKVRSVLELRKAFIAQCREGKYSFTKICEDCGISRPTGYKYLCRYELYGEEGLLDLSRAPHHQPNALTEEEEEAILALRDLHTTWGPRKLQVCLKRQNPQGRVRAASTIGDLIRRSGRVTRRRRRHTRATPSVRLTEGKAPNLVWAADFKGWFRTSDGRRCEPFTLTDVSSRFLLRCQALTSIETEKVKPILAAAFLEFGLPAVIRTDNGPPFASTGLGGLSRLSVWLLKLGVVPERIAPGHPEQNGRHERMHRTLKEDLLGVPAADMRSQQRAFDRYRKEYNEERPHEALNYATPTEVYAPSPRQYPLREPEFTYSALCLVRKVHQNGCIRWNGREVFLSEALVWESVGLLPISQRHWAIYVGPLAVAILDEAGPKLLPAAEAAPLLKELQEEEKPPKKCKGCSRSKV